MYQRILDVLDDTGRDVRSNESVHLYLRNVDLMMIASFVEWLETAYANIIAAAI